MVTATGGSVLDHKDTQTTVPTTDQVATTTVAPVHERTHRARRSRIPMLVIGLLVALLAFAVAAVMITREAAPADISQVRMSQGAWLQYRTGEDVSAPVVITATGVTQAAWQQYRVGERDSHAVLHPTTGMSLDGWQQYRAGERA